jgi:hypothetical protein
MNRAEHHQITLIAHIPKPIKQRIEMKPEIERIDWWDPLFSYTKDNSSFLYSILVIAT